MQLVSVQMDGTNYLSWSRAIIILLRAKDKLGFIDGKERAPDPDFAIYNKLQKVDSMIISCILTSCLKELAGTFVYTPFAKCL